MTAFTDNLYGHARADVWRRFADHLEGAPSGVIAIVEGTTENRSHDAFEKIFAALGYGAVACTFVKLNRDAGEIDGTAEPAALLDADKPFPSSPELGERTLFEVLEGLDPLIIVMSDKTAVQACSRAYRQDVPLLREFRLFGHRALAFSDFAAMLDDEEQKQKAWAQLKTLPHAPVR